MPAVDGHALPAPHDELWLRVDGTTTVAEGVILLQLSHPDGADLPAWEPGAHLELVLTSGLIRHYSLCGDPTDRTSYTVAILRVPDGRGGSVELHDSTAVGSTLLVRGPRNHFVLDEADRYLFIAGGIGITPIIAMARKAESSGKKWRMVYGGRSRVTMAFHDQLLELGPGKVDVFPEDEVGFPDLDAELQRSEPGTAVYACGPTGMLVAVEELAAKYADRVTLRVERFTSDVAAGLVDTSGDTAFEVELRQTGVVLHVPADRSLLDVVRDVVPNHPYSCTEGVCGSCETTVLEGIPDHRDQVLTDFEKETNETMMICVGRSLTPRLVLDV